MKIIDLFVQILNMSISASIVVILLTLLRLLFRRQMTAGFKYLMWGLVLFRLWLPFSLPLPFSLFNLFSQGQTHSNSYMVSIEYVENTGSYLPLEQDKLNLYLIGTVLWMSGCLFFALYQLLSVIYSKHLCRDTIEIEDRKLLEQYCQQVGIKQRIGFYLSDRFDTPAAVGLLRVKIMLPTFLDLEEEEALRHILLHELVHIRRGDRWLKLLISLTMIIHWFNPILWICHQEMLNDMETSCDEKVLSMLDGQEQLRYANTLLDVSISQKLHLDMTTLSFAERKELIEVRVMGALSYKPLSPLKRCVLALTMIVLALVTTTNPVAAYNGYTPMEQALPENLYVQYETFTRQLCDSLTSGNVEALLAASSYDDPYYQDIYSVLKKSPPAMTHDRIYPQNDELVFAYLLCEDKSQLVAQLEQKNDGIRLIALQEESRFAASQSVDMSEAVRFVQNLHRFSIVGHENEVSDWSMAALCISEEYHDRVKSGEIPKNTVYLPEEWIQSAAKTYFGRDDFTYTLDDEMYDAERNCYIYLPEREDPANAEVLSCEENDNGCTVTAILYRDPLKLLPQATITYKLTLKNNVN